MVVGFTTTYAISAYHHKRCEFESYSWRGVLHTTLCDKACQWLEIGQWFSQGIQVSSTNKTYLHDITEILWKVAPSFMILELSHKCGIVASFMILELSRKCGIVVSFMILELFRKCGIVAFFNDFRTWENLTVSRFIETRMNAMWCQMFKLCLWFREQWLDVTWSIYTGF